MLDNPNGASATDYMCTPLPWVTSSAFTTAVVRYDLPKVSNCVHVKNFGPGELAIGFTRNGVSGSNRFVISPGSTFQQDVRVKELFFMALATTCSGSVFAGLTTVESRFMSQLSGTLSDGSAGWSGVG